MIELVTGKAWRIWEPKKGIYGGKKFYVLKVVKPIENHGDLMDVIRARIDGTKVHMHKTTITSYQFNTNCRNLNESEKENVSILNDKLYHYKDHWANMKIKKMAKEMLLK